MNAAFFAIAAARKTDVVTDLSYSLSFAVLAIVLPFAGARETVQLAASLLVLAGRYASAAICSAASCGRGSTTASTR